jgi:putative SOS response-associated peptidase YedK
MCGRFVLEAGEAAIRALFGYETGAEPFPPRYNIAPTQPVAIVREQHNRRELSLVRWGLVPWWVKAPAAFPLIINARSEDITTKPAFRDAIRYRRCLFPVSGFYEWKKAAGKAKQPYFIRPADGGIVAFAGLWETWSHPEGGDIDTGAIITAPANAELSDVHHRMPVAIRPEDWDCWLGGDTRDALKLLRSAPDGSFVLHQVGERVNRADQDGPDLIQPVYHLKTDLFE